MELLLLKYGYLLIFAGVIVEGEAVLIAGSILASRVCADGGGLKAAFPKNPFIEKSSIGSEAVTTGCCWPAAFSLAFAS